MTQQLVCTGKQSGLQPAMTQQLECTGTQSGLQPAVDGTCRDEPRVEEQPVYPCTPGAGSPLVVSVVSVGRCKLDPVA